uniref:Uncharacterized protein n=1 Tax=Physcomitrium patens TaxID=3218 RepID=A0A7I3Z098_PHYPA
MAICSLVEAVQRWIAARVPGGVAVSPKVFLPSLVLFPWSDVLWTVGSATLWCGFFFLRYVVKATMLRRHKLCWLFVEYCGRASTIW